MLKKTSSMIREQGDALSKAILERQERPQPESQPGKGSIFYVAIPISN
jgi:hypothetical protein